ncbi:HTH-type transcriptional regulator McbR [Sulfitobacter sp. DSM 110093]|uniref:GntR family transcriptional regulator n=1 Tax=Sulfitobacter sp. DSM 110093 TaxID=2883127 RepID=UPI001FAE74BD|nr:GntR family transcriptional regulator [Sulfitobacter sp. DSM 110093]UOA32875.1 HTH-type transcriptional regulator McbR [Sulfitobacter sp. DSM 110093]
MPSSAADPIYDDVRAQILSGAIKPGSPLRQDEIAKRFGVSKIPVREALRRLEVENLVTFERNKGATVRQHSEKEILQLLDIRVALECRALELAIPSMITSDFRDMRQLLADYAQRTEVAQWSAMNARFHHMLYEPCGNTLLLAMIDDLQERLGQYLRLLVSTASGLERPMREHDKILEACEKQDVEGAVGMLRQHIEATQKEVAAFLRRGI